MNSVSILRLMPCSVSALVFLAITVAASAEESGSRSQSSEQPAVNGAPMIAMDRAPKLIFDPSAVKGYRRESRTCSGVASMAIAPGGRLWVAWYTGTTPSAKIETCPNAYVVVSTSGDGGGSWKEVVAIDPDSDGPLKAVDPRPWVDLVWDFQRSSEQEILLTTFREEDVLAASAEATARARSNRCIVCKGGSPE